MLSFVRSIDRSIMATAVGAASTAVRSDPQVALFRGFTGLRSSSSSVPLARQLSALALSSGSSSSSSSHSSASVVRAVSTVSSWSLALGCSVFSSFFFHSGVVARGRLVCSLLVCIFLSGLVRVASPFVRIDILLAAPLHVFGDSGDFGGKDWFRNR